MNMAFDILLTLCFVASGLYALILWVQAQHWTQLLPNPYLYPRGKHPGSCRKPEGYLQMLRTRLLAWGILLLLAAGGYVLGQVLPDCSPWVSFLFLLLGAGVFLSHKWTMYRAAKRFW